MREEPQFRLEGNTLYVSGDLRSPIEMQFDIMTQELLESTEETEVVIDLNEVTGMNSMYLGALAAVAASARDQKRDLLVKAREKVGNLIMQCGFDRIMTLQIE